MSINLEQLRLVLSGVDVEARLVQLVAIDHVVEDLAIAAVVELRAWGLSWTRIGAMVELTGAQARRKWMAHTS